MFVWVFILVGPVIAGTLFALRFRRKAALLLSGAVLWLVFLAFNLYVDSYSAEAAGTGPVFQLLFGTIVAAVGIAACWLTLRVRRG